MAAVCGTWASMTASSACGVPVSAPPYEYTACFVPGGEVDDVVPPAGMDPEQWVYWGGVFVAAQPRQPKTPSPARSDFSAGRMTAASSASWLT